MTIKNIKVNGFIVALACAIIVAYLFPSGAEFFHVEDITNIGIALIFFFYGLKLSFQDLKVGLKNYKLHILVQCSTFILFPLLVLIFKPLLVDEMGKLLWIGVFFLAVLPSSVSSSVVMVNLAKGNVPAAIFNASISGLIGVVVTPLWLSIAVDNASSISFKEVLIKLVIQIVIPITIGFLLNPKFGKIAKKYSGWISNFDKTIIALIVYSSFSHAFITKLFSGLAPVHFVLLYVAILILFFTMMGLMNLISKKLGFKTEDRITALFCGSKKSLVHGSVMARVIFGGNPNETLFILPIMLYHFSQILIVAVIAERFSKRKTTLEATHHQEF
ncbi:bile acid:sodium symporter family protein [Zhouia sp. PK063]|uniref:bile acid:sodium symporter family protein n=1 Tax=Zhouia sp. PK063 TaxID=3373602 RepID=UPI00379F3FA2